MNNENVTVIKDEVLGVEREYREVKRAAKVGERIKIVAATLTFGKYKNGDVKTVTHATVTGDAFFKVKSDAGDDSVIFHAVNREYVVLEPTDIVRIDGDRFRMVERKAAKGDRVIVIADHGSKHSLTIGTVHVIDRTDSMVGFDVKAARKDCYGWMYNSEYRVLESVNPAETELDCPAASDGLAASDAQLLVLQRQIDKLTARVAKLETAVRVNAEDIVLIEEGVSAEIDRLKPKVTEPTRDEIVARAKADVESLSIKPHDVYGGHPKFWPAGPDTVFPMHRVDFVVNRDERTVVAILRYLDEYKDGAVYACGIAKAAPDDCFNSHIGKAIALRRALRLDVPSEYVNAPQPTEPRVGDVVRSNWYRTELSGPVVAFEGGGLLYANEKASRPDGNVWGYVKDTVIIDDSRDGADLEAA